MFKEYNYNGSFVVSVISRMSELIILTLHEVFEFVLRQKQTNKLEIFHYFRPDWDKCAKYVEGGVDRWKELAHDQSSNDMVDILLAEMTGQALVMIKNGVGSTKEYFTGLVSVHFIMKVIQIPDNCYELCKRGDGGQFC